jgi:hypothetical protein
MSVRLEDSRRATRTLRDQRARAEPAWLGDQDLDPTCTRQAIDGQVRHSDQEVVTAIDVHLGRDRRRAEVRSGRHCLDAIDPGPDDNRRAARDRDLDRARPVIGARHPDHEVAGAVSVDVRIAVVLQLRPARRGWRSGRRGSSRGYRGQRNNHGDGDRAPPADQRRDHAVPHHVPFVAIR